MQPLAVSPKLEAESEKREARSGPMLWQATTQPANPDGQIKRIEDDR